MPPPWDKTAKWQYRVPARPWNAQLERWSNSEWYDSDEQRGYSDERWSNDAQWGNYKYWGKKRVHNKEVKGPYATSDDDFDGAYPGVTLDTEKAVASCVVCRKRFQF